MHQVYEDVFKVTPAMTVKLIVGSRNRPDARKDLIRKRPQSSLLKHKLSASEFFSFCPSHQRIPVVTRAFPPLGTRRQILLDRSQQQP